MCLSLPPGWLCISIRSTFTRDNNISASNIFSDLEAEGARFTNLWISASNSVFQYQHICPLIIRVQISIRLYINQVRISNCSFLKFISYLSSSELYFCFTVREPAVLTYGQNSTCVRIITTNLHIYLLRFKIVLLYLLKIGK